MVTHCDLTPNQSTAVQDRPDILHNGRLAASLEGSVMRFAQHQPDLLHDRRQSTLVRPLLAC
eukprot:1151089-Pelagomonas_calceolata.AAC.4